MAIETPTLIRQAKQADEQSMARAVYGARRARVRELLASGRLDDAALDELAALVGGPDAEIRYAPDPTTTVPLMTRDDVVRVWAWDRGAVGAPIAHDAPIPPGIHQLFEEAQRVARGDHPDDY